MKTRKHLRPRLEPLETRELLTLALQGVQPGSLVAGVVPLSVQRDTLPPQTVGVLYTMNESPITGPISVAPYALDWATAYTQDGERRLQAFALDVAGNVLDQSDPVTVQVRNREGPPIASYQLTSTVPALITNGRLEFTAHLSVTGHHDAYANFFQTILDGTLLRQEDMSTLVGRERDVQYSFDISRLSNGEHTLAGMIHTIDRDYAFRTIQEYWSINFVVDNGHTASALITYRDLHLGLDGAQALEPRVLYTDGLEGPIGADAAYETANPAIATVSADGVVHALSEGTTTITVRSAGLVQTVIVTVRATPGFAHFSKTGDILDHYVPGESIFVTSMFNLDGDHLEQVPGLVEQARAAGINTITTGFYLNPVDAQQTEFETWKANWRWRLDHTLAQAERADMGLLLTGDDLARYPYMLSNTVVTNPWAEQAVHWAVDYLQSRRGVIGIEMVDEVSAIWGPDPTPADGRWEHLGIPDDAFLRLMEILRGGEHPANIAWPVFAGSSIDAMAAWVGDPAFSDYASIFWYQPNFEQLPDRYAFTQLESDIDGRVVPVLTLLSPDQPRLMIASVTGPSYHSPVGGTEFNPFTDKRRSVGASPEQVALEAIYAATVGMAGVREYGFDWYLWKLERSRGGGQTGAGPFTIGTDRWQAMSSAFNLIEANEALLLQPQINAIGLGPHIVTGARQGPDGRLFMAASFADRAQQVRVDFAPYRYEGGPDVLRYRILGATVVSEYVPNGDSDTLTLAPGEAVWYVFRPASSDGRDALPPAIRIAGPLANATVGGGVLVTAQALDDRQVDRVEFTVDGRVVATDTTAPYQFTWDTTQVPYLDTWRSLTAIAYDTAGNRAEARLAVRVVEPPVIVEPLGPGDDSGASATDGLTNRDRDLRFQAQNVAPHARVDLLRTNLATGENRVVLHIADAGPGGGLVLTDPGPVPEGAYAYTVRHADATGARVRLYDVPGSVVIDTQAPVSVLAPEIDAQDILGRAYGSPITNRTPRVIGSTEPFANLELVRFSDIHGTRELAHLADAVSGPDGAYVLAVRASLPVGNVYLRVRATDAAGNTGWLGPVMRVLVRAYSRVPVSPAVLPAVAAGPPSPSTTSRTTRPAVAGPPRPSGPTPPLASRPALVGPGTNPSPTPTNRPSLLPWKAVR